MGDPMPAYGTGTFSASPPARTPTTRPPRTK